MRIESAKPCANGGWLHPLDTAPKVYLPPVKAIPPPTIDPAKIMREFSAQTWTAMKEELATSLGVSLEALQAIGCAWAAGHKAWAFPMKDWLGNIIGIRLRDDTGHKWAVTGSRAGLFYTEGTSPLAYITEGPTDTAAAISINLRAIGRPSCLGCEMEVNRLLKRKQTRRVVIVSDNDSPGLRGAAKLQAILSIPSVIWVPPAKDIREFVCCGGTAVLVDSMINNLIWTQPSNTGNYSLTQQRGTACTERKILCQA